MILTPRDWQAMALREASELLGTHEGAAKLAEAKRYGLLADEIDRLREHAVVLAATTEEVERERCALICESRIDDQEQARAALAAAKAIKEGSVRNQIDRLSHEGVVQLYNRTLQQCAEQIRQPPPLTPLQPQP